MLSYFQFNNTHSFKHQNVEIKDMKRSKCNGKKRKEGHNNMYNDEQMFLLYTRV